MADIPLPTVTDVSSKTSEPVVIPTETVSKETKGAKRSEPSTPTAKPLSGEAESSKPPSGEAESSKPPSQVRQRVANLQVMRHQKSLRLLRRPRRKVCLLESLKLQRRLRKKRLQNKRRNVRRPKRWLMNSFARKKLRRKGKLTSKSKKAAAENTEKAREAAAQQRKAKEQPAEGEQTTAQKRRVKAAAPENDPGDRPPPHDDDQPWEIYHYRPHVEVTATLEYDSETRGVKQYDLESAYNLDVGGTRKPLQVVKPRRFMNQLDSCSRISEEFVKSGLNRLNA